MPIRVSLVQLGKGAVGSALVDQVAARRAALRDRLGVDLVYAGIAGRKTATFSPSGLDLARWRVALGDGAGMDGRLLFKEAARALRGPSILVDATAEEDMTSLYCEAIEAGFHVVSCNKKPLSGPLRDYQQVKETCRRQRRFWLYEVTVGAGLPVIGTLRDLVDSGDRVEAIEGCFSGTLNFLCASLDRGDRFSETVARARDLGYTEPDPREDLSGTDVARKTLILAREAGHSIEPGEVEVSPFWRVDLAGEPAGFVTAAAAHDGEIAGRWREAEARGLRWRYVARVNGGCQAALREVPADGPFGRLVGPENIFTFRTARYDSHPLTVSGPGAGPAVTAAGVFADILRVGRAIGRTS
jgi:bifunctional aspartokinase / homoserine dehydrogenase 1